MRKTITAVPTYDRWSNLPNAAAIYTVISLARNPYLSPKWGVAHSPERDQAYDAAWERIRASSRLTTWDAARKKVWAGVQNVNRYHPTPGVLLDAVSALIVWDEAGELLEMPIGALKLLAASGSHAAIMLLPLCLILEKERNDSRQVYEFHR